jgi:restriction system protein
MAGRNQIFIDSLDGFEFEDLCADIYRRLGYSVDIKYTNDEGRDLILRSPEGEIIVAECKHWLGGSVSRPVVQKLHSAVITLPAKKGIILTTGYFGKPARDYVERLGERIELIDWFKLKDLAAKVSITLVSSKETTPVQSLQILEDKSLKNELNGQVFSQFMSSPQMPANLFSMVQRDIELVPAYWIRYSLNQDFTTSVGLIHQVHVQDALLLMNAEEGQCFSDDLLAFVPTAPIKPLAELVDSIKTVPTKAFKLGVAEIKEAAKEHIIRIYSTSVSYVGRNNHSYTLDCIPNKKNIFLSDIQQIYLPKQHLLIRALNYQYKLHFLENGHQFHWLQRPDIFVCHLCGKPFNNGLLCNSCGATTHQPRLIWPHGFRCRICSKTLCKRCAYWVPQWLIFKKIICHECSAIYPAEKVRKLVG